MLKILAALSMLTGLPGGTSLDGMPTPDIQPQAHQAEPALPPQMTEEQRDDLRGWLHEYVPLLQRWDCQGSDGKILADNDWMALDDGHYMVRIGVNWFPIQERHVMRMMSEHHEGTMSNGPSVPNPTGHAIIWAFMDADNWLHVCGFAPGWMS